MSEVFQECPGFRVRLVRDEDCENPRTASDCQLVGVVTVWGQTWSGYKYAKIADPAGDDTVRDAWDRLVERQSWHEAVPILERYIRILGGVSEYDSPPHAANSLWYMLPSMWSEVGVTGAFDPARAREVIKAEREEYQAWSSGDTWGYVVERRQAWQAVDREDLRMETWEEAGDGFVWGLIGYESAKSEARMALSAARGQTCEVENCTYVPVVGSTRCATVAHQMKEG